MRPSRLAGSVLCLCAATPAAMAVEVSATAIWNGAAKAGAATELVVEVEARQEGELRIVAPGNGSVGPVEHRIRVHPDRRQAYRLGITRPEAPLLELVGTFNGDPQELPAVTFYPAARSPLVVIAGTGTDLPAIADVTRVYMPATDLPELTASYGAIDLLILTRTAFTMTSAEQREALRQHVGQCGRVIVYAAPRWRTLLAGGSAGCTMASVVYAGDTDALLLGVEQLLRGGSEVLPDVAAIATLLPDPSTTPLWQLGGFILIYLVLGALASRSFPNPVWALVIPLGAAGLAWLIWTRDSVSPVSATWAETRSGADTARYVALVRAPGSAVSSAELTLDPAATVTQHDASTRLVTDHERGQTIATLRPRLRRPAQIALTGSVAAAPPLELRIMPDGPVVTNISSRLAPPATLTWAGSKFELPALAPQVRWLPDDEARAAWTDAPADRVLRARNQPGAAALLLNDSATSLPGLSRSGHVYLLVRP